MKKLFSLMLALALVMGLMAGCGNESTTPAASAGSAETAAPETQTNDDAQDTEQAAASSDMEEEGSAVEAGESGYTYEGEWAEYPLCDDGAETLTMWCEFPGFLAMVGINSYNEFTTFAAAQEATGVKIEFTEVSMTNANELFSLMCASGDMKDLISGAVNYYGSSAAAVEEEILVDLAEDAEQYMGNYMTILNDPANKNGKAQAYNAEGQLVEIKSIADNYLPTSGAQMRKDWLDEQNLEVPETVDELEEVLKAFKDAYNCDAPFRLSGETQVSCLVNGFGTAGASESSMNGNTVNMYLEDGEIKNGYQAEGYKAYLTMLNRWYEEGLLSKDFLTASSDGSQNNADGDITGGVCGVWYGQGNFIGQYETMAQTSEPDFSIVGVADFYDPEYVPDGINHFVSRSGNDASGASISVSTNCEDVELACKWLDYFWTEEGQLLCNYGIEGEGFEYGDDGQPHFTDFVVNSGNFQFYMVGYTLSGVPTYQDFDRQWFTYPDNVIEAFETWGDCSDDTMCLPTSLTLDTDQSDEYSNTFSDISTRASEMVGRFITGEADIDSEWDSFQQELVDMGLERCIEIYQEAYDAYLEHAA